jgi:hypothetical protein
MLISLRRLDEPLVRECKQLYALLRRALGRLYRVGPAQQSASHDGFGRFLEEYALRNDVASRRYSAEEALRH